jgi:hypothetical protein
MHALETNPVILSYESCPPPPPLRSDVEPAEAGEQAKDSDSAQDDDERGDNVAAQVVDPRKREAPVISIDDDDDDDEVTVLANRPGVRSNAKQNGCDSGESSLKANGKKRKMIPVNDQEDGGCCGGGGSSEKPGDDKSDSSVVEMSPSPISSAKKPRES